MLTPTARVSTTVKDVINSTAYVSKHPSEIATALNGECNKENKLAPLLLIFQKAIFIE